MYIQDNVLSAKCFSRRYIESSFSSGWWWKYYIYRLYPDISHFVPLAGLLKYTRTRTKRIALPSTARVRLGKGILLQLLLPQKFATFIALLPHPVRHKVILWQTAFCVEKDRISGNHHQSCALLKHWLRKARHDNVLLYTERYLGLAFTL